MPTKSKTRRKPAAEARSPSAPSATDEPKPIGGKLGAMALLLRRSEGATIAQLVEATGWREASIRGALAGALKTRGLVITSGKPGEVRVYRVSQPVRVEVNVASSKGAQA